MAEYQAFSANPLSGEGERERFWFRPRRCAEWLRLLRENRAFNAFCHRPPIVALGDVFLLGERRCRNRRSSARACRLVDAPAFFGRSTACESGRPSHRDGRWPSTLRGKRFSFGSTGRGKLRRRAMPYFFGGAAWPGTMVCCDGMGPSGRSLSGDFRSPGFLLRRFSSSWSATGLFLWLPGSWLILRGFFGSVEGPAIRAGRAGSYGSSLDPFSGRDAARAGLYRSEADNEPLCPFSGRDGKASSSVS